LLGDFYLYSFIKRRDVAREMIEMEIEGKYRRQLNDGAQVSGTA